MRSLSQQHLFALTILLIILTSTFVEICHARKHANWEIKDDIESSFSKKTPKGKTNHTSNSTKHKHQSSKHNSSPKKNPPPPPSPVPVPSPPSGPSPHTPVPPAPPGPHGTTFNVLDYGAKGDGVTDDTKAFQGTWTAACKVAASTMVVPSNHEFLVGPISFAGPNCQPNIVFQLDGTIVAPANHKGFTSGLLQWIEFTKLRGITIQGQGIVEGHGNNWWNINTESDYEPDITGSLSQTRPTSVRFYGSYNVTVTGITIRNSPQFHLKFDTCQSVLVYGITISSPGDSPNTDGIHLQNSASVTIHDSTLACGDDCVSIQAGCSNVFIHDVTCGPGHGISIGGLGKDNTMAVVSGITVQNIKMTGTLTAARIKTWQGGSGSVTNVRFANIQLSEVKTPIVIDQYYCNGQSPSHCANKSSAVTLSDITFQGFVGTYTVQPLYLACSDNTPCRNIHLADIELQPAEGDNRSYGPFCWNAYGDLKAPTEPPITCLKNDK
ncbi:Pectin lyase-like superfamily protein [Rhynchospora pubera]|uniref:Pectin lyase-like superfamily protein n=1 Tax=Rhynchospora pubera TaxID=906938 RepID=A0AAV8DJA8_9POAL|nr:Pectin lyase-like superfamily protein [Rhynchospora pubera]